VSNYVVFGDDFSHLHLCLKPVFAIRIPDFLLRHFSALLVTVLSVTTIIVSPSLAKVKDHCYRKKGGEGGWSSATCTKKATIKMNEK
jgi:hypothetical protein